MCGIFGVDGLDDAGWATVAEAPAGLIPVRLLALHALWDCWVHERDIVLDPFAGSNTTGRVAEDLGRRWISIEIEPAYLRASAVRFGFDPMQLEAVRADDA